MPVTVYLENRESKRTKEKAIRVQLSVKGVTLQSTIGHSINPDNWDGNKVKPKSYKNAKEVPAERINADLQKIKSHFTEWEMDLKEKPTKEDIKKHPCRPPYLHLLRPLQRHPAAGCHEMDRPLRLPGHEALY